MAGQPGGEEEKKDTTLTVVLTQQIQNERAPKQKKHIGSLMLAKMIAGESLHVYLKQDIHFTLNTDCI